MNKDKYKNMNTRPSKHREIYDRLDIKNREFSGYGEDDDYEIYQEGLEHEKSEPAGPLSRLPQLKFSKPAIISFILFFVASILSRETDFGGMLLASGDAVFRHQEYWRLLTSLFVHADIIHLLSNTLFFLIFGWLLRAYFGFIVFPVASILTGIISSIIALYFYNPHVKLIGASGMVYGMVALWLVFYIRYDIAHRVPVRIFRAFGFALVMLIPTTLHPMTSYSSHAAGFITGICLALLLLPFVKVKLLDANDE